MKHNIRKFFEKYILTYINRKRLILTLESNLLTIYRYLRILMVVHNIVFWYNLYFLITENIYIKIFFKMNLYIYIYFL